MCTDYMQGKTIFCDFFQILKEILQIRPQRWPKKRFLKIDETTFLIFSEQSMSFLVLQCTFQMLLRTQVIDRWQLYGRTTINTDYKVGKSYFLSILRKSKGNTSDLGKIMTKRVKKRFFQNQRNHFFALFRAIYNFFENVVHI